MSIKKKISVCFGLLGGAFLLQAAVTVVVENRLEAASGAMRRVASAQRNQMQANMMHYAVRDAVSDALQAAQQGSRARFDLAAADVAHHARSLRAAVAANRTIDLPDEVSGSLHRVDRPLLDYATAAEALTRTAGRNGQVPGAMLRGFEDRFHRLEEDQARVNDALFAQVEAIEDHSASLAMFAFLCLLLLSLAFGGLLWGSRRFVDRSIVAPIEKMAHVLRRMAAGQYDGAIDADARDDEIAAFAEAARAFREAGMASRQAAEEQRDVVAALGQGLDRLAAGDLTTHIEKSFAPSYEALRTTYNRSVEQLADLMRRIAHSANGVSTGASEIRAASDDLAKRNEQQASSLEETATAMNQVTSLVKGTAESTAKVHKSMVEAHHEAAEGGDVVRRAIEAMAAIEKSAQEITQIINVIDGIAFQTNLLALNAGVEAARAGDAGKGFAVVANEVRALAQRSADAAKDIKALITTSAEQVEGGVALVGETGQLLEAIVARVGAINGLVDEIARTTEEQASSLQNVNAAVGEMDRMTQQNAAMVEQSTAASRSLADEAGQLTGLVRQFRTSGAAETGTAKTPAPILAPMAAPAKRRPAPAPAVTGNLALKPAPAPTAAEEDWTEF